MYVADRMVRHLGRILPVLGRKTPREMVATNGATRTAASHDAIERRKRIIIQAMHACSSEQGRPHCKIHSKRVTPS
jgi:hypothetical protein